MKIPFLKGTNGGYRHLTLVSTVDGSETPLTSGRFVVQDILLWDHATNRIFYTANTADRSEILHVYAVKATPGQFSQCLTCDIEYDGVRQTYFNAEFNKFANNLVLTTEGPSVPLVESYSWNLNDKDEVTIKHLSTFESNAAIQEITSRMALPKVKYEIIKLDSGYEAKVRLQLPLNADVSGKTKYPMLVDVYAGPDSYNGYDRWDVSWGAYLASNKSIIYAQINGRGSGLRGDDLMFEIYRKFGTVEVEDQIETAR